MTETGGKQRQGLDKQLFQVHVFRVNYNRALGLEGCAKVLMERAGFQCKNKAMIITNGEE